MRTNALLKERYLASLIIKSLAQMPEISAAIELMLVFTFRCNEALFLALYLL